MAIRSADETRALRPQLTYSLTTACPITSTTLTQHSRRPSCEHCSCVRSIACDVRALSACHGSRSR
eukprot:6898957-Prymnesium_polylepis.1